MHARPQVREILVSRKMQKWLMIAKYPFMDRSCPTWRARKNYQRLCARLHIPDEADQRSGVMSITIPG
jgi:hypothetical protein